MRLQEPCEFLDVRGPVNPHGMGHALGPTGRTANDDERRLCVHADHPAAIIHQGAAAVARVGRRVVLNNPEVLAVPRARKNAPNDAVLHGWIVRGPFPVRAAGIADGPNFLPFFGSCERKCDGREGYPQNADNSQVELPGGGDHLGVIHPARICRYGFDLPPARNDVGVCGDITAIVDNESRARPNALMCPRDDSHDTLFKRGKIRLGHRIAPTTENG